MFKFVLSQEDIILVEKSFDDDIFNPITRHFIDVRPILPQAITRLQKILSKKNYDTVLDDIDLYQYTMNMIDLYPEEYRKSMNYNPKSIKQEIEGKIIKGVECKIGLYINENTIVERVFYVDRFNPVSKYSVDVLDEVIEITEEIKNLIRNNDIQNMWDEYDLINIKGYNINQIRELNFNERKFLINSLRR